MTIAGISAAPSQQAAAGSQHKHGTNRSHAMSDVATAGSSASSSKSASGKVGNTINITV